MCHLRVALALLVLVSVDAAASTQAMVRDIHRAPVDPAWARTVAAPKPIPPQLLQKFETPVSPQLPPLSDVALTPADREASAAAEPAISVTPADAVTGQDIPPAATDAMSDAVLDIKALKARLGNARLSQAKIYQADGPALGVSSQLSTINLNLGDVLAVPTGKPPQVLTQPSGGSISSSSTVLYVLDRDKAPRELGLVFQASDMTWRPEIKAFIGTMLVGLIDREDSQAHEALDVTIPIQLLSAEGSLDPVQLNIARIGGPYELVKVRSDGSRNPLQIKLVSQVDPGLPTALLKVDHPMLAISAPRSLPGFGVGSATVTISSTGEPLAKGQAVLLELDQGWLSDTTPIANEAGIAVARVRSVGLGEGHLALVPGRYSATPRTIQYLVPWLFLVSAALGSLAGGYVFAYMLNRNQTKRKARYGLDGGLGATVGLGCAVMAYAGQKLPEFIPTPETLGGEAAAFGVAFITAALATAVIHAFSRTSAAAK